jgi:CBS-domain-containing membrane protein
MTGKDKDKRFEFFVPQRLPTDDRLDGPRVVVWALFASLLTIIITALVIWNSMAVPIT